MNSEYQTPPPHPDPVLLSTVAQFSHAVCQVVHVSP